MAVGSRGTLRRQWAESPQQGGRRDLRLLLGGQSEKIIVRKREVCGKGGRKDLRLLLSAKSEKAMVRQQGAWQGVAKHGRNPNRWHARS